MVRFIRKLDKVGLVDNRPSTTEASQIGKIHQFSEIVVTLEPVMQFYALCDLESPKKNLHSLFSDWKHYLEPLGRNGAVKIFPQSTLNEWMNKWMKDKAVYITAPATPGLLIITLLKEMIQSMP